MLFLRTAPWNVPPLAGTVREEEELSGGGEPEHDAASREAEPGCRPTLQGARPPQASVLSAHTAASTFTFIHSADALHLPPLSPSLLPISYFYSPPPPMLFRQSGPEGGVVSQSEESTRIRDERSSR